MDGLNTVLEYLTSVPAWYLATSVDGQPHVRPFSFAQIQDGKLWFVTARTKDVWQELLQNQRFEATSWWPGHGWLILRGRAGLEDRASSEMREAGWKHLERLSEHYEGPNDPALVSLASRIPRLLSAITTNGCRSSSSQLAHPNNLVFAWAGPVLPGTVRSAGQYGARSICQFLQANVSGMFQCMNMQAIYVFMHLLVLKFQPTS